MRKSNSLLISLYLFTIIFFGIFYYFLPFSGDDWAWGSDLGIERLKNGFDGYNGRYIGNLLIILITRSVFFKVVFCTFVMFLLIFVLSRIFDNFSGRKTSAYNYVLALLSVFVLALPNQIAFGDLQPFQIFGSTIGWLSGFTNYVVPSVLILIFYYLVTDWGHENKVVYLFLVFNGAIAGLCVEHYTLFCIIFSFGIIAYRYYCYRKICFKSLSFLVGSLISAVIMFSNSSYRLMQRGDTGSNQRAVGFFGSLKKYVEYIFSGNSDSLIASAFEIMLFAVILLFLIFFFFKLYRAVKLKNIGASLPLICAVVMTLPLLFTNSGKEIYIVAPRCYFLQYFMLAVYIFGKIVKKYKDFKKNERKKFKLAASICLVFLILIAGVNYFMLDYIGIVRDKTVNSGLKNDNEVIEIIKYPKGIEHIQWASNFIENETYLERYKNFKGIPENKKVEIIIANTIK